MKRLFLSLLAVAVLASPALFAKKLPKHPDKLNYPELQFNIPKPERVVLKNGMSVYFYESHKVSTVSLSAVIRTGSAYESAAHSGLANLTVNSMRAGGTKKFTPSELDRTLEYLAADLALACDKTMVNLSAGSLKENFPALLDIVADVLANPRFDNSKFELEKGKVLGALSRVKDDPRTLTRQTWTQQIYGDHPYAWPVKGSSKTVEALGVKDIKTFHERFFFPSNTILAVSGDFNTKDMVNQLEKAFAGWKNQDPVAKVKAPTYEDQKTGVFYLPKELSQTNIRMGFLTFPRSDPDWFAVKVMNYILGGGSFSSRITQTVRAKEGLAYSAGSRFVDLGDMGYFFASTMTKAETTKKALDLILNEMELIQAEEVKDSELADAKNSYLNKFVFTFDTPELLVQAYVTLEYYGYPDDYYTTYRENFAKINKADVLRVAKKYLRMEALTILTVGTSEDYDVPVDQWGGEFVTLEAE